LNKVLSYCVELLFAVYIEASLHCSQTDTLETKYFYMFQAEAAKKLFPLDLLLYFHNITGSFPLLGKMYRALKRVSAKRNHYSVNCL